MALFETSEAWCVAVDLLEDPGGEERLLQAVQLAVETGNRELEAEARTALGIFWQHRERNEEAKKEFDQALALGLSSEADEKCIERYVKGLEMGYPASSFAESAMVAHSIRNFVTSRLPSGLISELNVKVDAKGGVSMEVEVLRDLSEDEVTLVNETIDLALRLHDKSTPVPEEAPT